MTGLVPGIHVFCYSRSAKASMAGTTSPAMADENQLASGIQ
jgi:hypothetical protein